ncbi:hypothetical protein FRC00_011239 [Tulasnella sp. 408]|nr:hypothetical protein FRC00_011239 [Tulasnella sp. 408]
MSVPPHAAPHGTNHSNCIGPDVLTYLPFEVERFKGTSWEECNEFILAIRTRALWEGKQRDPSWMADFAGTYFWQSALLWHCGLPQDVRQDWFKLEIALLSRWPPPPESDVE